jgi:BirA family biotin operon repressor/biotin-[acetyl-CoA-carboxylase] ligase
VGGATLISRREHFPVVGSTNDVVAGWLAEGVAEVCLAVTDEQATGRGREGRTWQAPSGAALLLSLGFRPGWIEPELVWRIAAVVSMAMAEAAEHVAGLDAGTIRLKWPNDLVAYSGEWLAGASPSPSESSSRTRLPIRKLAGVLGETAGLGSADPRAIVGIGTNVDWARPDFPLEIAEGMTSLRELAGDGRVERNDLLERFLVGLEVRVERLREGAFDAGEWQERQLTNDLPVRLVLADGGHEVVHARRVDPVSGGLVVDSGGVERTVMAGEIHHVRVVAPTARPATARAGV